MGWKIFIDFGKLTEHSSKIFITDFALASFQSVFVVDSIKGLQKTSWSCIGWNDFNNQALALPESFINLSFAITNKTQTVFDIWDGYIVYKNLFFLDGEPFEPMARYRLNGGVWTDFGTGQTVEDVTTGATGEVMFYERNFNDVKI